MAEKPKGYLHSFERPSCDMCKHCHSNKESVPSQEAGLFCLKTEPNLEVMQDDVCDEFEPI